MDLALEYQKPGNEAKPLIECSYCMHFIYIIKNKQKHTKTHKNTYFIDAFRNAKVMGSHVILEDLIHNVSCG